MNGLSDFQCSAILGLSRERVPLGVQARGLKLDRHAVKAAARELLALGMLAELPIDDVRDGRAFTWPERLLPDAPDGNSEEKNPAEKPGGVTCPCCGQQTEALSPFLIARAYQLPAQQEAILNRVWQAKGNTVTAESMMAAMYADDPDGGPEHEAGRKHVQNQLSLLRRAIRGCGVDIEPAGYRKGYRLVLTAAEKAPALEWPSTEALDAAPATFDRVRAWPSSSRKACRAKPTLLPPVKPTADEPRRFWRGRRLALRRQVVVDTLAARSSGIVTSAEIGDRLVACGFAGTRDTINVVLCDLRRLGFSIQAIGKKGFRMDDATREEWLAGAVSTEVMEAAE
jgi:hypothetical protein